jgi:hypothetical protein
MHNLYEWKIEMTAQGADAVCRARGLLTDVQRLSISDQPGIAWLAAQEDARPLIRMQCLHDVTRSDWSDVEVAMYIVHNQKWLDGKLLVAARRRWGSDRQLAEQWLMLGVMIMQPAALAAWADKLLPGASALLEQWKTWPGTSQDEKIGGAVSWLLHFTDCTTDRLYALPSTSMDQFGLWRVGRGRRLAKNTWPRDKGAIESWEIWAIEGAFVTRRVEIKQLTEKHDTLRVNASLEDVIDNLSHGWHNPAWNLSLKVEALTKLGVELGVDIEHIAQLFWGRDTGINAFFIEMAFPQLGRDVALNLASNVPTMPEAMYYAREKLGSVT